MRLPPPLIAAAGSLAFALALACGISLATGSSSSALAQDPVAQSVVLDEWSINPRHIVVKADQPVRFSITNTGTTNSHEIIIAGLGEELHSPTAAVGETVTWDVTFSKPGTYFTWCPRGSGSHKDRGMVGTLTVVPADQDAALSVPVKLIEYSFNPMSVTAVAGQTTRFQLENVGQFPHVLHITGQGVDMVSPRIGGGERMAWDVALDAAGTYEIRCSVMFQGMEHADLGMVGTLEVFRGGGGM
jgi:plastocyanin